MMGSQNQEEMETLVLDDPLTSKSYSNYRNVMATLSEPLSPSTTAHSDPLLLPSLLLSPVPQSPNSPKSSHGQSPSYADLILSPLDDVESPVKISENLSPLSNSSESSSYYLKIAVSNPLKEAEPSSSIVPGGNTFTTYLITTKTDFPDFGGSEFSVRRRFKDVVTLSDRLAEAYRGFFIPPRPDKSLVESQVMQKLEFVEQRRATLEKYLRRLAVHPLIRNSDELRVFLQAQGKLPLPASTDVASRMLDGAAKLPKQLFSGDSARVIGPQDVVQPAKGGMDLFRMFKELKQSVTNDWGSSKPPMEEDDKYFLEKKQWLHELEQQLSSASKQAEWLVKAQQAMGETMGELGLAFIKLAKFENEHTILDTQRIRAADIKCVYTAAVKSSRYYRALNAQTVKYLDTIHDYLGLMLAVNTAFSDRSSALLTVQTLLSELSSLHSKAEKLEVASSKIFGGDKSRLHKLEELKEAIKVTDDAKHCAFSEYQRIKENNRAEIERLNRDRKTEFLHMLKGFVINQVAYSEKSSNEWAKVAEETSRYARDSA